MVGISRVLKTWLQSGLDLHVQQPPNGPGALHIAVSSSAAQSIPVFHDCICSGHREPRSDVQEGRGARDDQRQAQRQAQPEPAPRPAAPAAAAPQASGSDQDAPKIVRAADVGRQAYRVGGALSAEERVSDRNRP